MFVTILSMALSALAMANLSPQEIRQRLEVRADTYILDDSGKHVISGPERTNYWKMNPDSGELSGSWSSGFTGGFIGIKQSWRVTDGGEIKVVMEEYSSVDQQNNLKGLIERKEYVVTNLEPIVWKVRNIKDKNFVVRMIPSLREIKTPLSVDNLPIAGNGISVSDNAGYLWGDNLSFNGKYIGMKTHRGTLALSYVPFAGAKEAGFAEGGTMALILDNKFKVNLKSESDFLPAGVTAKVYAVYLPGKKSKGLNSVHTWDSNREERIQEALKQ